VVARPLLGHCSESRLLFQRLLRHYALFYLNMESVGSNTRHSGIKEMKDWEWLEGRQVLFHTSIERSWKLKGKVVRISVHLVEACVSRGRTVSIILALISD